MTNFSCAAHSNSSSCPLPFWTWMTLVAGRLDTHEDAMRMSMRSLTKLRIWRSAIQMIWNIWTVSVRISGLCYAHPMHPNCQKVLVSWLTSSSNSDCKLFIPIFWRPSGCFCARWSATAVLKDPSLSWSWWKMLDGPHWRINIWMPSCSCVSIHQYFSPQTSKRLLKCSLAKKPGVNDGEFYIWQIAVPSLFCFVFCWHY